MTRNYTKPAQESIRGRSHTHSRTTSQQSHHGSNPSSSGAARDALGVVLDRQPQDTRPHLDTDNTSSRRRDLDTSRPRQESGAPQEYRPRRDTADAGRDHGMPRTQHGSRPRRDTSIIGWDTEFSRTQYEPRPVREPHRTPSGHVGAYRDHEEITERWPRQMERIERDDLVEGHRETYREHTRRERDPIMSLRTIEARRQNRLAHLDRVMEQALSRMDIGDCLARMDIGDRREAR